MKTTGPSRNEPCGSMTLVDESNQEDIKNSSAPLLQLPRLPLTSSLVYATISMEK